MSKDLRIRRTDRLYTLLEQLYRYKYLRTSFLRELTGSGVQGIIRQLKTRKDQGLVKRERASIHRLTDLGKEVLLSSQDRPRKVVRLNPKKGDFAGRDFPHSMMVCDVMASLEIGIKQNGCELITFEEILERSPNQSFSLPFKFTHNGVTIKKKIIPDAIFGVRYPDGKVSFFALETERTSTLDPKNIKRSSSTKHKLLAYKDIMDKKTYKTDWGIPNLHVLFVFPSTSRLNTGIRIATELFGSHPDFYFTEVPVQVTFADNIPVQEMLLDAPKPYPDLFTRDWLRAGLSPVRIFKEHVTI